MSDVERDRYRQRPVLGGRSATLVDRDLCAFARPPEPRPGIV